jgi:hypothetical protein
LHLIETGLANSPTPGGYANLTAIYLAGGDIEQASTIAHEALARWPDDTRLLVLLVDMPAAKSDPKSRLEYLNRLVALEPQNRGLQAEFHKAEAQASTNLQG